MTAFDIESVRRFAIEVGNQSAECSENDEFCSDLDRHIQCLATECWSWISEVKKWALAIYSGKAQFDPEVEALFRREIVRVANKVRPHAQHGREVVRDCYSLTRLNDLERFLAELDFMAANWVRPMPSVLVGGRIEISAELATELEPRVQQLSPLPEGWTPEEAGQKRRFMRKR